MKIKVKLTGTSPLLMHNPQMVDPELDICRQLKALTAKRKKTAEDLRMIEKLEWYGGIYVATNSDGKLEVVQPTSKARKCFINTAKVFKLGKSFERALSFTTVYVPLIYDGPRDLDTLWEDQRFRSRLSVGIGNKRVMRVRPQFMPWQIEVDGIFVEDAGLDFDEVERIIELAGVIEGIGDNRVNGYGRFIGKVEKI